MTVVKPRPPTQADLSERAASGQPEGDVAFIDASAVRYTSPAAVSPDTPIGTVGDQLVQTPVAMMAGGVELTVLPVEDPAQTYRAYKLSPLLSPIVESISTNVYAAGFQLQGTLEPDKPDAIERVREALLYKEASSAGDYEHEGKVTDAAVKRELKRIRTRIRNESQFLRAWFRRACPGSTILELMTLLGHDLEIQGDGYIEVLRDVNGHPSKLIWAPAWSVRAQPLQDKLHNVLVPVPVGDFDWTTEVHQLRFRSYVQINLNGEVIARYKQYGDPRVMSRLTGKYFANLAALRADPDEWLRDGGGIL